MRRKPAAVEEVPDGLDDLRPDPEDGMLFLRAQPQVSVLHQERRAVLLRRDRIILGHLKDLDLLDGELVASRRPFVLPDMPPDDDRGLLGQGIEGPEQGMFLFRREDRRLDDPRSVSDEEEPDFAARALVVNPAADLDVLVLVAGDVLDVNPLHNAGIIELLKDEINSCCGRNGGRL